MRPLLLLALATVALPAVAPQSGARGGEVRVSPPELSAPERTAAAGNTLPSPEQRARERDILAAGALAALFATVGAFALAAGLRWRAGRRPAFLLGAAMVQHSLNVLAGSEAVRADLGGSPSAWIWLWTVTNYLIPIPWALIVELVAGPGWKSSIRRTWQAFVLSALGAILFDLARDRPGAAAGPNQWVVVAGALVGLANVSLGGVRMAPGLGVLRAGYLVFLALVVSGGLAGFGLLPRSMGSGQVGLLIFIGSLAYTVVSTTLRGQGQLQAIELELGTARRIQASLLPSQPPRLEGATVAFRHVPATAVAGDVFEFLDPGPRRVGLLVADVCGHGVPAALIASMVMVAAAAQRTHADDPARVLGGIHATLASELPDGRFVTAVCVHVDLDRGSLRHASAGHPPALVRRATDGTVLEAGETGPLLAAIAPADYPVAELPLAAGDRVLLYTDGVVEAMRADGEMFGLERLSALLASTPGDPDALMVGAVAAVARFAGRRHGGFEDDLTLVALDVEASHRGA